MAFERLKNKEEETSEEVTEETTEEATEEESTTEEETVEQTEESSGEEEAEREEEEELDLSTEGASSREKGLINEIEKLRRKNKELKEAPRTAAAQSQESAEATAEKAKAEALKKQSEARILSSGSVESKKTKGEAPPKKRILPRNQGNMTSWYKTPKEK